MHNVDYLEGSIESLVVLSFSRLNLSLYFLDHCVSLHLAASIFHFFFLDLIYQLYCVCIL
jgi:hypothetical protein